MRNKFAASLCLFLAAGAFSAFAANPFEDVPSDSWAYKSVVELADAGVIQGVDGQYFQGNRVITRYEMAEMIAKAMAHMDKASVEQRALIVKLADEYADELKNLGVRVDALENRVGNVRLYGDARLRYRRQSGSRTGDNSWDYRVRVRGTASLDGRTEVTYGINSDNRSLGENGPANENHSPFTDMAKVDYHFGGRSAWNLSVGRIDGYLLGNAYGYNYSAEMDRAELKYQDNNWRLTGGYGKMKDTAYGRNFAGKEETDPTLKDGLDGVKTGYGEIEGFFGKGRAAGSAAGLYYNDFTRAGGQYRYDNFGADNLWGGYFKGNYDNWHTLINYEHIKRTPGVGTLATGRTDVDDADVWIGKLRYGQADFKKPKSWDIWMEYINAEDGAYLGGNVYNTENWRFSPVMDNLTSWGAGLDYTVGQNAIFSVMQSFGSKTKEGEADDPKEQTRAQFVFVF